MVSAPTRGVSARKCLGEKLGLQGVAHPRVVGHLGVEVAQRATEQCRFPRARRRVGFGMRATEAIVIEQQSDPGVVRDQPGLVAHRGMHPMNTTSRQLSGCHRTPFK